MLKLGVIGGDGIGRRLDIGDTGELAWASTRVKIAKVGGPDQSLILFGGATRERPEWTHGRGEDH